MNDRERLVEKDEFAKLFDIGGAQLLVMYGASEEPEIELHTQVNGIRVRTALGFGSWSLADEMFNGLGITYMTPSVTNEA